MNKSPICFGARNNQFGSFNVPCNGTLASVKLVHVDGYVKCNQGDRKRSFWGCIQDPTNEVNVEIKNDADTAILPSSDFLVMSGEKESLQTPGYNSLSTELVLSASVSNPPKVTKGQWLRLSLREDSLSSHEEKSCCDVYARFSETTAWFHIQYSLLVMMLKLKLRDVSDKFKGLRFFYSSLISANTSSMRTQ